MGRERPADRLVHADVVERLVPQVPHAVAQVVAAGLERPRGAVEVARHAVPVARREIAGGVDLERHAGQHLGDRVVELDGEACALLDLQSRRRGGQALVREFLSAPVREPPQERIPREDGEDEQDESANECTGRGWEMGKGWT